MPGLCHALHRRGAAPEADRGRAGARSADHRRAAVGQVLGRAVRDRVDHPDPFDPRAQRRGDAHALGHRAAYRRLEVRSRSAGRATSPTWPRLQRLGDEGVLAMVCDSTNALRPGEAGSEADGARVADRAGRALPTARGGGLLRLQRGAARIRRRRRRAAHDRHVGAGRPLAVAHRARGARDRLSDGRAALPDRGRGRLPAARQGAAHLHRQPGRAARGAWRASPRTSIPTSCWKRATR